MGGAASSANHQEIKKEHFDKIREEYEKISAQENVTEEKLFDHMKDYIKTLAGSSEKAALICENMLNSPHPFNNCDEKTASNIKLKFLDNSEHLLSDVKTRIVTELQQVVDAAGWGTMQANEGLSPLVTKTQNFDKLLIPSDHYVRRPTDVFYVNDEVMLRSHLSAHLSDLIGEGQQMFYTAGDVYRRLEESHTHSELSHQLEFVHVYSAPLPRAETGDELSEFQYLAEKIARKMLPGDPQLRWEESDEFPYMDDSPLELQTLFNEMPLDIARGGRLSKTLLAEMQCADKEGYLLSFDLDHIAMVMHNIKSIRELHRHECKAACPPIEVPSDSALAVANTEASINSV